MSHPSEMLRPYQNLLKGRDFLGSVGGQF